LEGTNDFATPTSTILFTQYFLYEVEKETFHEEDCSVTIRESEMKTM
jgi:hypothetical protein